MKVIFDDYAYTVIEEDEFFEFFREHVAEVYADTVGFNVHQMLSDLEKDKLKNLRANLTSSYKLYLKITQADKTIGWLFGCQSDDESFTMMNSGLLKPYQNQGIYSCVLKDVLAILAEAGFQKVESQHQASNNQVIIPKLKAGFIITGLDLDDKVGMRVRLTYYFNSKRRDTLAFRIGSKKLLPEFESYLSLWETKDNSGGAYEADSADTN